MWIFDGYIMVYVDVYGGICGCMMGIYGYIQMYMWMSDGYNWMYDGYMWMYDGYMGADVDEQ